MSGRERILGRVREALSLASPGGRRSVAGLPDMADHRRVLPPVGSSTEEQFALFAKNALELKATFTTVGNLAELNEKLRELCEAEKWKRVAAQRGDLAPGAAQSLGLPVLFTNDGCDQHELEQCDAGVSECDALVAQTGSVLVTSRSAGGRALSVLPPHHVVVARREQMVPDLPRAFALIKAKYGANYPSMISFITGPSRTGDIERILVLGAHGPKKLTILCL